MIRPFINADACMSEPFQYGYIVTPLRNVSPCCPRCGFRPRSCECSLPDARAHRKGMTNLRVGIPVHNGASQ